MPPRAPQAQRDASLLSAGPRVRGHDVPADDHPAADAADPLPAPAPGPPAAAAGDNAAAGKAAPTPAGHRPGPATPFLFPLSAGAQLAQAEGLEPVPRGFCVPPVFPWGSPECPAPRGEGSCACCWCSAGCDSGFQSTPRGQFGAGRFLGRAGNWGGCWRPPRGSGSRPGFASHGLPQRQRSGEGSKREARKKKIIKKKHKKTTPTSETKQGCLGKHLPLAGEREGEIPQASSTPFLLPPVPVYSKQADKDSRLAPGKEQRVNTTLGGSFSEPLWSRIKKHV